MAPPKRASWTFIPSDEGAPVIRGQMPVADALRKALDCEANQAPTMPTKEQWAKIQLELSHAYGLVEMEVDGIQVTWRVSKENGLKYKIIPFLDGRFAYSYFMPAKLREEPSDDVKRNQRLFCQAKKRTYFGEKKMIMYKKCYPKSKHKELEERNKYVLHDPCWSSPRSLVAHLKKAAQTITIKRIGYAEQN